MDLEKLIDLLQELTCAFTYDGKFTFANHACLTAFGYTNEELLSKKLYDIIAPGEVEQTKAFFKQCNQSKKGLALKSTCVHKNGTLKTIEWKAETDDNEELIYASGIDITAQILIEKQLKQSIEREKELANIVRFSPIAIANGYSDGRLGNCNKAFEKLTGYSQYELEIVNWNKELTPEKWYSIESECLAKLSPDNNYINYEKEYIKKNGEIVQVELFVYANYTSNKTLVNYVGFIVDISERKTHENKLKINYEWWNSTFNAIDDSVCIISLDGKIKQCNKSTLKLLNLNHDEILNKHCFKLIHGTNTPHGDCPLVKMSKTKKTEYSEFKLMDRWIKVTTSPLFDSNNNMVNAVHIISDISELKNSEEALKNHQKNLEKMVKERTEELEQKNKELDRSLKVFVGRELTIKKLQDRIKELEKQ